MTSRCCASSPTPRPPSSSSPPSAARVRGPPAALRAGHRRGRDRQLRLGPGHRPAGLGRPARGRSSATTAERFDETVEAFIARLPPRRPRADGGGAADRHRHLRRVRRRSSASCCPSGETRWVQGRGRALADDDGTAVRLLGAGYDTTGAAARRRPGGPGARGDEVPRSSPSTGTGGSPTSTPRPSGVLAAHAGRAARRVDLGALPRARWAAPSRSTTAERWPAGEERVFEAYYPAPLERLVRGPRLAGPGRAVGLLPRHHRAPDGGGAARGGAPTRLALIAEVAAAVSDAVERGRGRARTAAPAGRPSGGARARRLGDRQPGRRGRPAARRRELARRPGAARPRRPATPSCGWRR